MGATIVWARKHRRSRADKPAVRTSPDGASDKPYPRNGGYPEAAGSRATAKIAAGAVGGILFASRP
jgi:hypothetical protein